MNIEQISTLVHGLPPHAFATLDAVTFPSTGVRKETKGEQVLLFSGGTGDGGYSEVVRKRLRRLGKDPDDFVVQPLPWGERIIGTPLLTNKGKFYLQTVTLVEGESKYFVGLTDTELSAKMFDKPRAFNGQGLPPEKQVKVRAYALDNIKRLVIE